MKQNAVRIIGGQLRSRKLTFPDVPGLRPTPDRIRETLFNWLGNTINNARCLDLFAGSGALGFEALSRGAANVTFIENNAAVVRNLYQLKTQLKLDNAIIHQANALTWLTSLLPSEHFDVVFLDPPFEQNLILPCLDKLIAVTQQGFIYMESEPAFASVALPNTLTLLKDKRAGNVYYRLFKVI